MASNQKLEEILVSVRLGAFGLAKRLEPFSHLVDGQDESDLPKTGNEALDALLKSELRLNRMIDLITNAEKQVQLEESKKDRDLSSLAQREKSKTTIEKWGPSEDASVHRNNIRVDSLRLRDERTMKRAVADDVDPESDDEDDFAAMRGTIKMKSIKKDAGKTEDCEKKATRGHKDSEKNVEHKAPTAASKSRGRKQYSETSKSSSSNARKSRAMSRKSIRKKSTIRKTRRGGKRADLQ